MPENEYKLIGIKKSDKPDKKYVAIFKNIRTGRQKETHFGARGMSDYTIHKDPERKARYVARHKSSEDWEDPTSAGALSYWILWNKPTKAESIASYRAHFGF